MKENFKNFEKIEKIGKNTKNSPDKILKKNLKWKIIKKYVNNWNEWTTVEKPKFLTFEKMLKIIFKRKINKKS